MLAGNDVSIRLASEQDAVEVARLATQLGYPSDEKTIAQQLTAFAQRRDHAVFVAVVSSRILGWVHVSLCPLVHSDEFAEVHAMVVDEAARGRGLGRLLMQRAEQWAVDHDCLKLRLRSNVIREGAHAFYEHLGYRKVKTQHAYQKQLAGR